HKKIIGAVNFNLPIICVGNLSVGGTGKSPMVDFLVSFLKNDYPLATLSRGYKRRTSGYVLANEQTTAIEIGDEPMQFHLSHPDIAVSVCEKRIEAIPQLLYDRPETKLVILDDAFQHREIIAGFNIILTDYANLYTRDFFLPTGDLRDQKESARRADVIVVTKCPPSITQQERYEIMQELKPLANQHIFFTTIQYESPFHIITKEEKSLSRQNEVLLVCGIANPLPLTDYIHESTKTYDALFYSDHHIYTVENLNEIEERFRQIKDDHKMIVTTEKDAVRLIKFKDRIAHLPLYVLPISVSFLFGQENEFKSLIHAYPKDFYELQQIELMSEKAKSE
ncbi:MAG: tetraacyldisaccharide 4-kinase, partial [Bacteroidota bacterium]